MRKLAFVVCTLTSACVSLVQGSGHLTNETRDVPAYTSVSIANGFKGTIAIGTPSLVLHLDDNLHKYVKTSVASTGLEVSVVDGIDINPSSDSAIHIVNPVIDAIDLSGGSSFVAAVQSKAVTANLSGGSELDLHGQAQSLAGNLSGGSQITSTVSFEDITLDLSGSSHVVIYASRAVHISASGGSEVTVHGNPAEREVSTSGGSSIHFD